MSDLEEKVQEIDKRQDKIEIKIEGMSKDIEHIRERIDNGLSVTITKVYEEMLKIGPMVNESSFWIGKIKWGLFWIFIVAICGGIITGVIRLIP